jgi:hypothetical protein
MQLIEIKTGVYARDVYEAVGQLKLYPSLIGLDAGLDPVCSCPTHKPSVLPLRLRSITLRWRFTRIRLADFDIPTCRLCENTDLLGDGECFGAGHGLRSELSSPASCSGTNI